MTETQSTSSTPDSDGEVPERIAIISFERKRETAITIESALSGAYDTVEILEYHGDVFADNWDAYDCFVGLMASGIAVRKTAGLLEDKWADPAIVVVDESLTWAVPITGGHHGANQIATELADLGAIPATTTASEAAGKQGVEARAKALDAHVVNGDSTVQTNLAVLNDELGPVARVDGPRAVLVDEDVTVLKPNPGADLVLGTGTVADISASAVTAAWDATLAALDRDRSDVSFVATATRKGDETGLLEAAASRGWGVVCFDKPTLKQFEGPSSSKAPALIGWPGIAEAAAIAGGRAHDLQRPKERFDAGVTVAVGR